MWLPASVAIPIPARASAPRCAGSAGGAGMSTELGTPRRRVRDLDLADDEIGRAQQLAAGIEEAVGVGLVEDQVPEQEEPRTHVPSSRRRVRSSTGAGRPSASTWTIV